MFLPVLYIILIHVLNNEVVNTSGQMKSYHLHKRSKRYISCKFCRRNFFSPSGTPDIGKYCNGCRLSRRELAVKYFSGGSIKAEEMQQDYIVRRSKAFAGKTDKAVC